MARIEDAGRVFEQVQKDIVFNLAKSLHKIGSAVALDIAKETPVDTGRAQGNWQMSGNRASFRYFDPSPAGDARGNRRGAALQYVNSRNKSQRNSIIRSIIRGKMLQPLYIGNAAPYIHRLNRGYSSQAGAGWVERVADQAFARYSRDFLEVLEVL